MFSFFSAHRASQLPGRRKVKAFEVRIAKGELLYPGMRWNIVPSINVHTSHTLTASSKSSNFSFNLTMRLRGFISHLMARNIFLLIFRFHFTLFSDFFSLILWEKENTEVRDWSHYKEIAHCTLHFGHFV